MDTRTKIISLEQAAEVAARLRADGRLLAVAVGGFEVLLAAHARLLSRLRDNGAALLVAVYNDASFCQRMNRSRPILNEQARAQMVAALGAVDWVVIWTDTSLKPLTDTLRPDQVEQVYDERNIIEEIRRRHNAT